MLSGRTIHQVFSTRDSVLASCSEHLDLDPLVVHARGRLVLPDGSVLECLRQLLPGTLNHLTLVL